MRRVLWLLVLALGSAGTSQAGEPRCPLDLHTCLSMYERTRVRPWLGIHVDRDSSGRFTVVKVEPGSPARRAGIREGDLLRTIEGRSPEQWFATKAGWGPRERGKVSVLRGRHEVALEVPYEAIPEDVFARMIGVHMIQGHLAYMNDSTPPQH